MPQLKSIQRTNTLALMATCGMLALLGGSVAVVAAPPVKKLPATTQTGFTDNTPLTEEQKIVHVLNRAGFGPRPGDVERVKTMGVSRYINQQLHPEQINDATINAQLANFPILNMPTPELMMHDAAGSKVRHDLGKIRSDIQTRMRTNGTATGEEMMPAGAAIQGLPGYIRPLYPYATPEERNQIKVIMDSPGWRESVQMQAADQVLAVTKALRAVESDRQLYEVLCDFWSNHFNIDTRKSGCRILKVVDEREVIRKHALDKFRDLLGASAHSPAMMLYLDNATNQIPIEIKRRPLAKHLQKQLEEQNKLPAQPQKSMKGGVNENYAREIMELHTLGVDGGYTQKDVQEVARCFTGWGVGNVKQGNEGEFYFDPQRHDDGEKMVLGHVIPAGGGIADGEKVLNILASHPSTMRFISRKLCQRLVADEPPASLVDKCVATWKSTDGDIREIVRTIITSPEFYSRVAYRQKIKSPFEYAVSSVRAVGATIDLSSKTIQRGRKNPDQSAGDLLVLALNRSLVRQVATMGQPLFQYSAAPGWPEDSRKWVSSGALVSRLNFALSLLRGEMADVSLPPAANTTEDTAAAVNVVTDKILNGDVSPATRATLLKQATAPAEGKSRAAGQTMEKRLTALALGSPEFQRR